MKQPVSEEVHLDTCLEQFVDIVARGQADQGGVDVPREHQVGSDTALRRAGQRQDQAFVRDEIGRWEDQLFPGGIDAGQDGFSDRAPRGYGPGWNELNGAGARPVTADP